MILLVHAPERKSPRQDGSLTGRCISGGMPVMINANEKYGRLTYTGKRERGVSNPKGLFLCECGTEKWIVLGSVKSGNTKSCGCLQREAVIARIERIVDGRQITKHPLYSRWCNILRRCSNPNLKCFPNYGGRGIKVCPRWSDRETGFANFVADMGECPPGFSIERIDNDGDYCPKNCRWASRREQNNNTRRNVTLTIDERTQTVSEWAREAGIDYWVVYRRIKLGWSPEDAVFRPIQKRL